MFERKNCSCSVGIAGVARGVRPPSASAKRLTSGREGIRFGGAGRVRGLRTLKWTVYGRNLRMIAWSMNCSNSVAFPNTQPTLLGVDQLTRTPRRWSSWLRSSRRLHSRQSPRAKAAIKCGQQEGEIVGVEAGHQRGRRGIRKKMTVGWRELKGVRTLS